MRSTVRAAGGYWGLTPFSVISQADSLSINGFVRNEPDGSVRLDVEGTTTDLEQLLRRINVAMGDKIENRHVDRPSLIGHKPGFRIAY